jgi:sugar phosphate isomerase/epimerase
MISRRSFHRAALAALPLARVLAAADSTFSGVRIGVQSYSFRDRPLDAAIDAIKQLGIATCELSQVHSEPKLSREELRRWRTTVPLSEFEAMRKKFDAAGIALIANTMNVKDDWTDEEMERAMQMTKALGLNLMTSSATLTAAKRFAPIAEKHGIIVAFHGHSNRANPNEFCTPESFAKGVAISKSFKINLDIGHFVAANFDPVAYLKEHRGQIAVLHLKDRKKDQGPNTVWGEGDTPLRAVLQLLKTGKYDIPADIEYEYKGDDTVAEVRRCLAFCKQALA